MKHLSLNFWQLELQAKFNGVEYVITQPMDLKDTRENVRYVLAEEYKLLCLGNTFKLVFDGHAAKQHIKAMPSTWLAYH